MFFYCFLFSVHACEWVVVLYQGFRPKSNTVSLGTHRNANRGCPPPPNLQHARRSTPPPLCSHLSFRIFRIFPICDTPFGPGLDSTPLTQFPVRQRRGDQQGQKREIEFLIKPEAGSQPSREVRGAGRQGFSSIQPLSGSNKVTTVPALVTPKHGTKECHPGAMIKQVAIRGTLGLWSRPHRFIDVPYQPLRPNRSPCRLV